MRARFPLLLLSLFSPVACSGGPQPSPFTTVRDSAGVTLVESSAPAWAPGDEWRVADAPSLTLGASDEVPGLELSRVVGAHRLDNGAIVVANAGTHELRYYGEDGTPLRGAGTRGNGQDQFSTLVTTRAYADTIFAFDLGRQRILAFDADGDFVRAFPLPDAQGLGWPMPVGRLDDGSWIVVKSDYGSRPGARRASATYSRMVEGGNASSVVGVYPGADFVVESTGEADTFGRPLPFGRRPSAVTRGGLLVYGSADRFELEVRSPDGTLQSLIRRPHTPEGISTADIERWQREMETLRPRMRRGEAPPSPLRPVADLPLPEARAAHGRLLADSEGNLWVAAYSFPREDATYWSVFDAGGSWLGEVEMPERFRLLEIGGDYVLGVQRERIDEEYVRAFPLLK